MSAYASLKQLGPQARAVVIDHLQGGALFVLVGRAPHFHCAIDQSGEIWTGELAVLGVMARHVSVAKAEEIYRLHRGEYGDVQRQEVLVHAFYPDGVSPSRN